MQSKDPSPTDTTGEEECSPSGMSRESRVALEIDAVLAVLSGFAVSDLGEQAVLALAPVLDAQALSRERDLVDEIATLYAAEGALLMSKEVAWVKPLAQLRKDHGIDTGQLLALATLLESFGSAQRRLGYETSPCLFKAMQRVLEEPVVAGGAWAEPAQHEAVEGVERAAGLAERVRSALDPRGNVRSDATPQLASLSAAVRRTRDRLYSSFQSYAREHDGVLGDDTVTRAEGRLAVLLPAGHRGRLSGIVHGRSGTAKSYYFEPLELVEDNNRLQESQTREEAERARILRELAGLFRDNATLIGQIGEFVARLDGWQAAHRFRMQLEGRWPTLTAEKGTTWNVHGARHPLLDPRLQGLRESKLGSAGHTGAVVPLEIEAGVNRVLVITGPNAGGKTVALKSLGVLSYLAACGWPVPLAEQPDSSFPLFSRWIAVVGDGQDVLAERSTFSARLERLSEVWHAADANTLVLLDEVGSGTNPEEGAALTIALLERLVERGCFAVMTTHLLQVANAALALPGCASLAMELDSETGTPTFRIRTGAPGSSHALDLARRLGLDESWVNRAEELLGEEQLTLRHLIAETERSRQQAKETLGELEAMRANQETLQRRQEEELVQAREERIAARKKASGALEQFRRSAREELTREVRRVRTETQDKAHRAAAEGALKGFPEQGAAGPSPRTASKEAARRAARLVAESPLAVSLSESAEQPHTAKELGVGDAVRHRALGWTGRIDKLLGGSKSGQKVEVLVRGKRVRCELHELAEDRATTQKKGKFGATLGQPGQRRKAPAVTVVTSKADLGAQLMLVGQRVAPALQRLDSYLDQALVANLEQVRVVHGFGSGRLREAVREHLRGHPLVAKVKSAPAELGGDGATVVIFRD